MRACLYDDVFVMQFLCYAVKNIILHRKFVAKSVFLQIRIPSAMNEEQNDTEERVALRPKSFTIVKYAEVSSSLIPVLLLMIICVLSGANSQFICRYAIGNYITDNDWLFLAVLFVLYLTFWLIMRKITEVKVNLKITEKGLEQTRLSGSKLYPEYRMITWKAMTQIYMLGRTKKLNFLIDVKNERNFRISAPQHPIFEKQEKNFEQFCDFLEYFEKILRKQRLHKQFEDDASIYELR